MAIYVTVNSTQVGEGKTEFIRRMMMSMPDIRFLCLSKSHTNAFIQEWVENHPKGVIVQEIG